MGTKRPRWVDKPEFAWTPQPPLRLGPDTSIELPTGPQSNLIIGDTPLPQPPASWPAAHNRMLQLPPWIARLAIALAQSVTLAVLLFGRDHHWWPDNGTVAGLALALLLAPLLPVQGLGRISLRPLLVWSIGAAIGLFGLGFYQHWRAAGSATESSGMMMSAMAGTILFIGQSLLLAHGECEPPTYRDLYRASWTLGIQLLMCGLCALALWLIWRAFPALRFILFAAITFAAAAVLQFLNRPVLHRIERGLVYVLTASLPVALLFSVLEILVWSLTRWLPPFALSAATGTLMIAGINASYGDGGWRPQWRRRLEYAGAILLLPLAILAVMALYSRVTSFGFTANRVVAVALLLLLSAYALTYAGAALISLWGGRAMERLETANLLMAFVIIGAFVAMITPLADPLRLAVAEQSWRLLHGAAALGKFDYLWLCKSGLRFGHEALQRLPMPSLRSAIAP